MNQKAYIIAVDVGGTYTRIGLCETSGAVVAKKKFLTAKLEGKDDPLLQLSALIRQLKPKDGRVIGISVGLPALVDKLNDSTYEACALRKIKGYDIRSYLEASFGVPVFVGNDAKLAALGEHRYGAGRGSSTMLFLTISTGIGGAVILNKELVKGARGFAGEAGVCFFADPEWKDNVAVKPLESIASGSAIAERAVSLLRQGRSSRITDLVNGNMNKVTAKIVSRVAKRGDPLANEVFQAAGFYIGLALVNLIHLLNPDRVVLGGGVMKAGNIIFKPIKETVAKYAMPATLMGLKIVRGALGDNAGLLGGLVFALNYL